MGSQYTLRFEPIDMTSGSIGGYKSDALGIAGRRLGLGTLGTLGPIMNSSIGAAYSAVLVAVL